jgi:GT2 family glycosyltransferase
VIAVDDGSSDGSGERLAYLEAHPAVALVGSRVRLFPARETGGGMRRWAAWHNALLDHEAIAREAFIDSPLAHGTALIRREWLARAGGWAERGWAEDLDLWLRLIEAGARFAKLPQVLHGWRQHGASATRRDPRYARARFVALKCTALARGAAARGPTSCSWHDVPYGIIPISMSSELSGICQRV